MRGAYGITHWGHTLVAIILLTTGIFLYSPELRALLFKGHFLTFSQMHRYSGIVYIPLTTAFVIYAFKNNTGSWKKFHVNTIALSSSVLSLTGFAMWFPEHISLKTLDFSALLHQVLTLILLLTVAIHIFVLARKNKFTDGV